MAIWTVENLKSYREFRGWPSLEKKLVRDVIDILDGATEDMRSISNVSWIEPAIHFNVTRSCFKGREGND